MDANEPCSTQLKAQKDESEVPVQCDCLPPAAAAATAATAVGAADLTSMTRVNGWNKDEKMRRFYYVKFPSYEDRNLKAKIDEAKRQIKKLNEARGPIAESLMFEKMDQERLRWQLQCLKPWRYARDELGELRQCLSKLRCSPSSEWRKQIRRSSHRLIHGSKSLREERQILRELRQLESRNERTGVENDEEKEWIQRRFGSMEDIQLRIEVIPFIG
ncbi:hypothetical protein Nepgr_009930 [Nepenthes gracilis]|uniref:Uncharacterized protein n=1 Tax=Nepenthes gracilis TaxID=150966 RepID=A0AAD3SBC2_NEPGR|nr:hypothetical protein Nepgr_009930 [Nepenthes gracilis]